MTEKEYLAPWGNSKLSVVLSSTLLAYSEESDSS